MYLGAHIAPNEPDELALNYQPKFFSDWHGFSLAHPCEQRNFYIQIHLSGKEPGFIHGWAAEKLWQRPGFFDNDGVAFEQIMEQVNLSRAVCNEYRQRVDDFKKRLKLGLGVSGVIGLAIAGLVVYKLLD